MGAKKQAVAAKRKTSLPPGPSSTPQSAKKPKPSSSQASAPGEDIVDMVEPHLEDVDIKSIKAEPEPSGSGAGGGGPHGGVEADLHGDESYGAEGAGDDNGDFGAEGEFEGFDQYGDGNEFDDSMGAAGGSGAAADGKGYFEGFWAHVSMEVAAYFVKSPDNAGLYTCLSCGKKEKSKTNIVTHVEYHHYSPGYECRFC